jgi:hypothetical protein
MTTGTRDAHLPAFDEHRRREKATRCRRRSSRGPGLWAPWLVSGTVITWYGARSMRRRRSGTSLRSPPRPLFPPMDELVRVEPDPDRGN